MTELRGGSVLGDTYRLVDLVGRGGMGEVWRVEHTRLPRQFAVKVLHGAAAANVTALARFRREAEIASRLGHPNIVQVLDFNTLDDGTPYMVMELLKGESLRDRALRGPLSLEEVLRILRQVASALREAHRQGVIHRDLKPDNIFLCHEELEGRHYERAKVLDFGISKIQGSQTVVTRDAEVLGTPIYMAPEQAAGRHTLVDGRTDEFALAAIAYELLSGQAAFGGETLVEVVNKIMNGTPPPLGSAVPTLPTHVISAIDRALSKERDHRYPQITDFVDALGGDPALLGTTAKDDDIPTDRYDKHQPVPNAGLAAAAATQDGQPPPDALGATVASHDHLPAIVDSRPAAAAQTGPPPRNTGVGDAPPLPTGTVPEPALGATAAPVNRGRRVGLIVGLALGIAGLAALGAVVATQTGGKDPGGSAQKPASGKTASTADAGVAQRTAAAVAAGTDSAATSAYDGRAALSLDAAAESVDAATGSAPDAGARAQPRETKRPRQPRAAHRGAGERLPRALAAELARAEKALRAGNADEALHLARRSLQKRRTRRAFAVMVRAYCVKRDLRMAKATLLQLRGAARRKAVRWCRKRSFDIGR